MNEPRAWGRGTFLSIRQTIKVTEVQRSAGISHPSARRRFRWQHYHLAGIAVSLSQASVKPRLRIEKCRVAERKKKNSTRPEKHINRAGTCKQETVDRPRQWRKVESITDQVRWVRRTRPLNVYQTQRCWLGTTLCGSFVLYFEQRFNRVRELPQTPPIQALPVERGRFPVQMKTQRTRAASKIPPRWF